MGKITLTYGGVFLASGNTGAGPGVNWRNWKKFGQKTPYPQRWGYPTDVWNVLCLQAGEALACGSWFNRLPHFGQNLGSRPKILKTISKGVSSGFRSFFRGFFLLLAAKAIR